MADEDDWEAAVDQPPAAAVSSAINPWADEDVGDDAPVTDSWDEDPEVKNRKTAQPPPKPKALSKHKLAKIREQEEQKARTMTVEERVSAKMEAQRAVEESDHQLTHELFAGDVPADAPTGAKGLGDYPLSVAADFETLAADVADRVLESKSSANMVLFANTLLKRLCDNMKLDDLVLIGNTVTVLQNKARQADKGKKKGAAAKSKKTPSLNTGGGKSDRAAVFQDYNSAYDNADDYDFL